MTTNMLTNPLNTAATVLIVDDDRDIREFFRRAVQVFGEKVRFRTSKDIAGARKMVAQGPIALAFIDKALPDGDGVEFAIELARDPDCATYVVTGSGTAQDCLKALEHGARDYITKPLHLVDLRNTIRRHVPVDEADMPEGEAMGKRRYSIESAFHLVGESPAMIKVAVEVHRIAKTDVTALVVGESGTGKEVIAKQIHQLSERREQKFVAVNCAAIPTNLIESELFGHEKGAFTDARQQRTGLFEEAQGGTIFLDEITSTTLDFQVKLLRVLQEEKVRRVGANREIDLDVRVIAASNQSIDEEIKAGRFREDLYYRLKGAEIYLPRLAEREKDIVALARHFGNRVASRAKKEVYISKGAIDALNKYSWPGNVRELELVMETAIPRCNGTILLSDLPDSVRQGIGELGISSKIFSMRRVEQLRPISEIVLLYAMHCLDVCDGNKSLAAERARCDRKFFYNAQERLASGNLDDHLWTKAGVAHPLGQSKKNASTDDQEKLPL